MKWAGERGQVGGGRRLGGGRRGLEFDWLINFWYLTPIQPQKSYSRATQLNQIESKSLAHSSRRTRHIGRGQRERPQGLGSRFGGNEVE